jgi:DNA-binding CsgD family transcriptional regulator
MPRSIKTDFPLAMFTAFSDALVAFYSAPTREEKIETLTAALRRIFGGCEVAVAPRDQAARSSLGGTASVAVEGEELVVPIPRTRWQLTLHRPKRFSRREKRLAHLFSTHLSRAFRSGSPGGPRRQRRARLEPAARNAGLTAREAEVLRWIVAGRRDAQIAPLIGASLRTVNKHVENILRKLGAENRSSAALIAEEWLDGTPSPLVRR